MPDKQKKSRGETLPHDDSRRELPELEYGYYLIEALSKIGFCRQGPSPVEYQEVNAWQVATGVELTPWEAETVVELSNAYTVQLVKSKEPRCDAPFWKSAEGVDVSAKFKALAKRKRKNG